MIGVDGVSGKARKREESGIVSERERSESP